MGFVEHLRMENTDFFAARPKLPRRLRFIRGCAIFIGLVVGLVFLSAYWQIANSILSSVPSGIAYPILQSLLVVMFIEILLLIPLWRLYALRRWACGVLVIEIGLINFLLMFAIGGIWILVTIMLSILFTLVLAEEYPNLKTGF